MSEEQSSDSNRRFGRQIRELIGAATVIVVLVVVFMLTHHKGQYFWPTWAIFGIAVVELRHFSGRWSPRDPVDGPRAEKREQRRRERSFRRSGGGS